MRRILFILVAVTGLHSPAHAADHLAFWNTPRHGSNCFNEAPPDAEYFQALSGYGASWVRLTFSKWKSSTGKRDFLFGNLDDYRALVPEDLATLRAVLDRAQAAGLKVVLCRSNYPARAGRSSMMASWTIGSGPNRVSPRRRPTSGGIWPWRSRIIRR